MKNDLNSNTSSRLSIVLCLDISPSMRSHKRIENLNSSIQLFYNELKKVDKVSNSAEVAIVTFSTEVKEVTNGFEYFDCLAGRKFTPVPHGGTNLSGAMLKSIDLLEKRLQELNDAEIDHYIPFIIL